MDSFKRDISLNLTRTDNNDILVRDTLKDRFHDIVLEVIVDHRNLNIKDIRVEFERAPTRYCQNLGERLKGLIGTPVKKGLTRKIFEVTGGGEGCGNIRNMLLASLPLVLNLTAGAGIDDEEALLAKIEEELEGTCIGYTKPKNM